MKFIEKIFSVRNSKEHKIINLFGIKLKIYSFKLKCANLENELNILKKELANKQSLQEKRHMYLCRNLDHTNRVLNKIIDKTQDTELKKSQIKFIFKNRHYNVYDLNIDNPKTFNEKIQWLSLNYYANSEEIHQIVDKYQFKNYIKEKLGDNYTIPLLGKWDNPDEIDYNSLPEKFVLKSNWGGDGTQVKIIQNKNNLNIADLNKELKNWLSFENNTYYYAFNGVSKDIKPCIIAEEYMPIREGQALEYKMFCLNGTMKFCLVEIDYFGKEPKRAYYDKLFNEIPFSIGKIPKSRLEFKPETYDRMVELAENLSKEFPFVRVDFYDINGRIYIGEMTFTSGGGFSKYNPVEWDYKLGEILDITKLMKEKQLKQF